MPPASAYAIASLIWRRSKYFSGIAADGTVRAQRARSLSVFRSEMKVAAGDAGRCVAHMLFDHEVVRRDVVHFAAPHVEQDQPWVVTSGHETTPRCQTVDPQLQRVSLHQHGVEAAVGLEVDQRGPAVEFADAIHEPAHTRA